MPLSKLQSTTLCISHREFRWIIHRRRLRIIRIFPQVWNTSQVLTITFHRKRSPELYLKVKTVLLYVLTDYMPSRSLEPPLHPHVTKTNAGIIQYSFPLFVYLYIRLGLSSYWWECSVFLVDIKFYGEYKAHLIDLNFVIFFLRHFSLISKSYSLTSLLLQFIWKCKVLVFKLTFLRYFSLIYKWYTLTSLLLGLKFVDLTIHLFCLWT